MSTASIPTLGLGWRAGKRRRRWLYRWLFKILQIFTNLEIFTNLIFCLLGCPLEAIWGGWYWLGLGDRSWGSTGQKIFLQKLHHFQPVRKYFSILSFIIFFFQAAGVNMFFFIEKLRSYVPDFIITQPTFGYPQVSYKVNGLGGKLLL